MDPSAPVVTAPNADQADFPSAEMLLSAWQAGDMDEVDRLLDRRACFGEASVEDPTAGLIALQRSQFELSSQLLSSPAENDQLIAAAARLAGNLAALEAIDAQAARAIAAANDDHFEIELGRVSLPHESPADIDQQWNTIATKVAEGMSVGLLGVGDGRLMDRLLRNPPALDLGRQQCVFVIEPDIARLRGLFTAFDFTDALRQARVQWCLGEAWPKTLADGLHDCIHLGPPTLTLTQGLTDEQAATYQQVMDRYRAGFQKCCQRVDDYYRTLPADHFESVLGPNPPRPPRVLLCTSRFTTVLQHAIADTACGFEQMGYEVEVLKEQADHHRLTAVSYRQTLDRFRPDVVFMIDHLRHEFRGCFPAELPFICWIQDDLGNLTNPAAGASIGPRDFVLTCAESLYVKAFSYPATQCVYLHKLTAVGDSELLARDLEDVPDIVFVSHGSAEASALAEQLLDEHGDTETHREILNAIRDVYARGDWIATMPQLKRLLSSLSAKPSDAFVLDAFNRLNNVLYRQQALSWVVDYVRSHDCTLGLYGHGWEDHTRFAEFARGPVNYGDDLADLTASAKVNLQLLPFSCLHQRLLDGIAADGFFLIRAHPLDDATHALHSAIAEHVDPAAKTISEACRSLDPAAATQLRDAHQQLSDAMGEAMGEDLPAVFGGDAAMREMHEYTALPPHYADVRFANAAELHEQLDRYLSAPAARRKIAHAQRAHVAAHKSYRAGMSRVMRDIHTKLRSQNNASRSTAPSAVPTVPRRPRRKEAA